MRAQTWTLATSGATACSPLGGRDPQTSSPQTATPHCRVRPGGGGPDRRLRRRRRWPITRRSRRNADCPATKPRRAEDLADVDRMAPGETQAAATDARTRRSYSSHPDTPSCWCRPTQQRRATRRSPSFTRARPCPATIERPRIPGAIYRDQGARVTAARLTARSRLHEA